MKYLRFSSAIVAMLVLVMGAGFVVPVEAATTKKASTAKPKFGTVGTFLGRIYAGDGLDANSAYLDNPKGFTADSNCTFTIADTLNNIIRQIDGTTNIMTRLAGTGHYLATNGPALKAAFKAPQDVEIGPNGEFYITDTENGSIRLLKDGIVTPWLKNLKLPTGTTISGSTLFIGDTGNSRILKATIPDGAVTVVTNISSPGKMVVYGDYLFVVNAKNTRLSRVHATTGETVVIKDGLTDVDGVAVYNGKIYFVASDRGMYNEVWRYDPTTGEIVMLIRVVETEWYNHASDILFCKDKMYLLFSSGSSIFRLEVDATNPVKIAGIHRYGDTDGGKNDLVLGRPKALILSKDKTKLYIVENHRFKVYDLATGTLSFIAGSPMDNWRDDIGNQARTSGPTQAVLSSDGKRLWFADKNNNRIRSLIIDEARLETLTGAGAINQFAGERNGYAEGVACSTETKGVAGCAYFDRPTGVAISQDGKTLYVTDTDNYRIRTVDLATGATSLLAGGEKGFKSGVGSAAKFKSPTNLLLSSDGKKLFVVDVGNHAIRQIDLATNKVTTIVGSGKAGYREGKFKHARLSFPDSLALGPNSTTLLMSEVGDQRIRIIDLKKKEIRLAAGSGQRGSVNGAANKATFNNPKGMVLLSSKVLLVADLVNDLIRVVRLR